MLLQSVTSGPVPAPDDPFAAGHLGELTRIVSFDLVDAAINAAGAAQKRVRRLRTRVVVYVLLAGVLSPTWATSRCCAAWSAVRA